MSIAAPPLLAIPSLARAMMRTSVAGFVLLAAAPAIYAWARGSEDLAMTVTFASIVGAAALGFAFDDPADNVLIPCPTTRASRRVMRCGLIGVLVAGSWLAVAVAARSSEAGLGPVPPHLPGIAAAGALALAFGAIASRGGNRNVGLGASTAALVFIVASSGLAPYIPWLPMIGNPNSANRWWVIAAGAAALAMWWSRDPAARLRPSR